MRWPLTSFTCPGSKGSIMRRSDAIRRIHLSDLMLIGGEPSGVLGNDDVRKLRGHVPGGLRDLDRKPAPDRPVDLRRPAPRVGLPESACSRIAMSSGSAPSSSVPYSLHMRSAPPCPKMCSS